MALPAPLPPASQSVAEAAPRDPLPRMLAASAKSSEPQVVEEICRYVAQMSGELAGMARSAKLDLLAYFLDMARIEAMTRGRKGPDGDRA